MGKQNVDWKRYNPPPPPPLPTPYHLHAFQSESMVHIDCGIKDPCNTYVLPLDQSFLQWVS